MEYTETLTSLLAAVVNITFVVAIALALSPLSPFAWMTQYALARGNKYLVVLSPTGSGAATQALAWALDQHAPLVVGELGSSDSPVLKPYQLDPAWRKSACVIINPGRCRGWKEFLAEDSGPVFIVAQDQSFMQGADAELWQKFQVSPLVTLSLGQRFRTAWLRFVNLILGR